MKKSTLILLAVAVMALFARESKQESCQQKYERGLQAYEAKKYAKSITALSQVRLNCIGGFEAPDSIYYNLGLAYLAARKPSEARLEFRVIVDEYPHSVFREEALYRLGYCSFKTAPIVERDSRVIRRAMRELNQFMSEFPQSEYRDSAVVYIDSIYGILVEKEFLNAEYYTIVEKYESAVIYYKSIIDDYPLSPRVSEAKLLLAESLIGANRFTEAEVYLTELAAIESYGEDVAKLRNTIEKTKERLAKEAQKR